MSGLIFLFFSSLVDGMGDACNCSRGWCDGKAVASAPTSGYGREERGKRRAFDTVISYIYLSRDYGAIDSMRSWEQSHAMGLDYMFASLAIDQLCLYRFNYMMLLCLYLGNAAH